MYKFVESDLPNRFPDQFSPFCLFGFDPNKPFNGTLIRIPLRQPEQAKTSLVKKKPYNINTVLTNLSEFKSCSAESLLFLNYVQSIWCGAWNSEPGLEHPFQLFHTAVTETKGLQEQRSQLVTSDWKSGFNLVWRPKKVSFVMHIRIEDPSLSIPQSSMWAISKCLGAGL